MNSTIGLPSPPSLASLVEEGPVSLFLDFDGTLVDLAPGPDAIRPRANLVQLLARLNQRLEQRCALVSGRALSDIESHIGALPMAGAGSHGADVRALDGAPLGREPGRFPEAIERTMREYASANGVDYEAKPHGGALHYRSAPEKGKRTEAFAQDLALKHGWKAQSGKCVVEIVKGDSDKGTAVRALMEGHPFKGSRPYFLGDDLTDEAGFSVCEDMGGAGILIGSRRNTNAEFQLPDVASVHAWLGLE